MENLFCSEWPQGQHYWAQNKTVFSNENGFQIPYQPCDVFASSGEVEEDIAHKSGSKSHSQAEKRRRDRINAHLTTLRKLIPRSHKMDKAALLGSVVEHVNDLKRKSLEASHLIAVPSDSDQVTIECYIDPQLRLITGSKNKENIFIKVSLCCEDRPELLAELNQALKGLKLTIVKGDMACLGGRIKSILVLCLNESGKGGCITGTIQSLKIVLGRITSSPSGSSCNVRSKRQKMFLSSY